MRKMLSSMRAASSSMSVKMTSSSAVFSRNALPISSLHFSLTASVVGKARAPLPPPATQEESSPCWLCDCDKHDCDSLKFGAKSITCKVVIQLNPLHSYRQGLNKVVLVLGNTIEPDDITVVVANLGFQIYTN